jgi:hypothetical protein
MITGRNDILEWFKNIPVADEVEMKYWTIYPLGKVEGVYVAKSPQDDGLLMQDSITALAQTLKRLSYGKFTIIATPNGKKGVGKGFYKTDIEISSLEDITTTPQVSGMQQPVNMAGYMSKEDAIQMASDIVEKKLLERDMKDLQAKLSALEKENKELSKNTDGIGRIVDLAAPYLPAILGKIIPGAQPLAQVGTLDVTPQQAPQVMPDAEMQGNRLVDLLEKCQVVFGVDDSVEFLEKLMNVVEANPHFVPMIKSMVK